MPATSDPPLARPEEVVTAINTLAGYFEGLELDDLDAAQGDLLDLLDQITALVSPQIIRGMANNGAEWSGDDYDRKVARACIAGARILLEYAASDHPSVARQIQQADGILAAIGAAPTEAPPLALARLRHWFGELWSVFGVPPRSVRLSAGRLRPDSSLVQIRVQFSPGEIREFRGGISLADCEWKWFVDPAPGLPVRNRWLVARLTRTAEQVLLGWPPGRW